MAIINFPILYIPDPAKGRPLFNGQIFVGIPDLDPEDGNGNPINSKQLNVVQEDGTVVPVGQPFILSPGGVPTYNGATVRLDVEGNYSLKILDKNGAQTYFIDNVFEGEPITTTTGDARYTSTFKTVAEMLMDDRFLSASSFSGVTCEEYNSKIETEWSVSNTLPSDGYYLEGTGGNTGLAWFKLNGTGLTPRHYGAFADLIEDDTESVLLAMEHQACFYNYKDDEYLIKTATLAIAHNFTAKNLQLVWDGDEDIIMQFSGIAKFYGGNARELVQTGKLSENRMFQGLSVMVHENFNTDGFSTAFDTINGSYHANKGCKSTNIRGFDAQHGYGVNSSSLLTVVDNYEFSGAPGNNGRHAVYINGAQDLTFFITKLFAHDMYKNPINVRITDTAAKVYGVIDGVVMRNVQTAAGVDESSSVAAINISNPDSLPVDGVVHIDNVTIDTFKGGAVRILGYSGSSISNVHIKNGTDSTVNPHVILIEDCDHAQVSGVTVKDTAVSVNGQLIDVQSSGDVNINGVGGSVSSGDATVRFGAGCSDCVANYTDVSGFTEQWEDTDGVNSFAINGFHITQFIDKSGQATPNVEFIERIQFVEAGNLNVTDFLGGIEGQVLVIVAQTGNVTIIDGATIETKTSSNVAIGTRGTFQCVKKGSRWLEV